MKNSEILNSVKKCFLKALRFCRRKPSVIFAILLLAVFVWAGLIFEQYVYQAVYFNQQVSVQETKINQAFFEKIKSRLQEKETNFNAPNNKTYSDIFGSPPLRP